MPLAIWWVFMENRSCTFSATSFVKPERILIAMGQNLRFLFLFLRDETAILSCSIWGFARVLAWVRVWTRSLIRKHESAQDFYNSLGQMVENAIPRVTVPTLCLFLGLQDVFFWVSLLSSRFISHCPMLIVLCKPFQQLSRQTRINPGWLLQI